MAHVRVTFTTQTADKVYKADKLFYEAGWLILKKELQVVAILNREEIIEAHLVGILEGEKKPG